MIPLYHDFGGETVLVFGGGPVGARKARRFAREAQTRVVSPAFPEDDYGGAELIRAAPSPEGISGWFDRAAPALVVAATDAAAVNEAIGSEARSRGVLVNRADNSGERDHGSVVVPATVEDGGVTVAVSTGGRSPALSKELRRRIEAEIDGAGELADITASVRRSLKDRGVDPERRRRAVRDVVRSAGVWKDLDSAETNPRQTVDAVVEAALGENT